MLNRLKSSLSRMLRQLLLVDMVNNFVFRVRFFYLVSLGRRLKSYSDQTGVLEHDYSVRMLLRGQTSNRPVNLIRPLSIIDRDWSRMRVLSVGCRYETELLYLVGHGCRLQNIRGLDMISYSPWVDLGNMHEMPYPNDSWDAIILAWVIAYSDQPQKAADEVVRVATNGALVAISLSYVPQGQMEDMASKDQLIGGLDRRQSTDKLLDIFGGHVDRVYFRHDSPSSDRASWCGVIFSIKK